MTDRYLRHSLIDWFSQEDLKAKKALVIGAGAIGNEVVKNLALLGVGHISIFDFDRIEEHNLTRSVLFRDWDIGQDKAVIAARRARELDPSISVDFYSGDLWETLTFSRLRSASVLFCCVDNFEARIRCNTLCYLAGVDFVNVGIDSRYAEIGLFPFGAERAQGCYECTLPESVYRRMSQRYSCGHLRKLSFVEKKIPTTIVTSAVAGAFAVSQGLRLGNAEAGGPVKLYLDTIYGALTRSTFDKATGCPCCGRFGLETGFFASGRDLVAMAVAPEFDRTVVASEPILVSYTIGNEETVVFEKASRFDSEFPASVSDDPDAVRLNVRDQFRLSELSSRYAGRRFPGKFSVVIEGNKNFVCEFVEDRGNG